jgi:hypothetical protein
MDTNLEDMEACSGETKACIGKMKAYRKGKMLTEGRWWPPRKSLGQIQKKQRL